jgi:hypothetical protein
MPTIFDRYKEKVDREIAKSEGVVTDAEAAAQSPATTGPKFGKAFTPEEKKAQATKLADILRKRQ